MDCVFVTYSIIVLKILFMITAVSSASFEKETDGHMLGSHYETSDETIIESTEEHSDVELLTKKPKSSALLLSGPNGHLQGKKQTKRPKSSALLLSGPNGHLQGKKQTKRPKSSALLLSGPNGHLQGKKQTKRPKSSALLLSGPNGQLQGKKQTKKPKSSALLLSEPYEPYESYRPYLLPKNLIELYSLTNVEGSGEQLQGKKSKNLTETLSVTNEEDSGELLQGKKPKNLTETLSVTNEEDSGELLQGKKPKNLTETLSVTNEEDSGEQGKKPKNSTEILDGTNDGSGNLDELLPENKGKNKTDVVELDLLHNETVIAKVIENHVTQEDQEQENHEQDKSMADEELDEYDEPKGHKGKTKLIGTSYYIDSDIDVQNSENLEMVAEDEEKRYKEELNRGNKAESYGSNPHFYQPDSYPELSRRFLPHDPYQEEENINLVREDTKQTNLEPKLASPDLVLAVAKESAILEAARPKNPSDYIIEKNALRSGNYWNAIWKEDGNPAVLRSNHKKPLGVITAKINPGSNLYDLVTKLKQISPRLLYVINKKIKYYKAFYSPSLEGFLT